ncbi:MAG TPA: hypothetical protein ENI73_06390, partial [Spirochaetes bacterium]|nr:hypothetical protein [Spirochaetota bacterium]
MIIKKVVLENWKQIDQLDIDLDHGVNLIHGPNEIGKSSLVEALNYVLLKESSSNKKEVKELMKWGTDLKAKIKVYFKLDEKDYLIHKSFPKGETSLHISTNGDQVKLSEGKTADQKILDLLNIKDIKEKGLLDVFWSHQNSLSSYKFELDQNTKASLSDNIQKNLIQPKTEQFHRGIIESYSKFFTSTGRIKAGSGISENNTRLQKYYDDKNGINNKLNKIVELDQQITDSSKELSQIELAILQHEKDHKNLIDRQSQYNKRKREYESAQKDLSLVEKDLTYLKKEKDKYLGLVKEITDAEKLLGEGDNKLKEINSTIDKENTVLQELESQEQKVIEELTQLEGEIQKDKDKADYLDKVIELNSLKEELKEAEQLKENLNELKKERESIVQKMDTIKIPDKKTIEKAEKLLHEIEKEKSILEALQLKVTILPKKNINIKLKKDSLAEE